MVDKLKRSMTLAHVAQRGDTLQSDLWYPGGAARRDMEAEPTYVRIGLYHVRAADDVRISYDFDRDGWKVEQDKRAHLDGIDEEWTEVAFVEAWAFEEE